MKTTRWGILGTGNICRKFAEGLKAVKGAELVAVGSRSEETASAFGESFGVSRCHGSYEALARDDGVDVVYIGTPHVLHRENTLLCLESGRSVLCEKPAAINAGQVKEMVACARGQGLFFMEAMWTRFFPAMVKLREILSAQTLGEIRMVKADFCFRSGWNPEGRLLNPELGGGGLLDVGVYTVALASMVLGAAPVQVTGAAHLGETGVDEQAGLVLQYENGALAVLTCAVRTSTPHEALVVGTEGMVKVPHLFWQPDRLVLCQGGTEEEISCPREGNGYNYEAEEVGRCLGAGETESPVMPWDESIAIMETLDALRAQWGLRYPTES